MAANQAVNQVQYEIKEKRRGLPGYDPCDVQYDYIYPFLVHNMNYATKNADGDSTIDETSGEFSGYSGDAGWRLLNKQRSKGDTICSCVPILVLALSNQYCLKRLSKHNCN
jgi:hypothetical protein